MREPPAILYHYTTPVGALGIIESGEIRASMIHYMNDSREFGLALALARRIIDESAEVSEHSRRLIADEFLEVVAQVAVFVFSLTECGDQLSQWRAYSGAGGGYALGFHRDVLSAIAQGEGARLAPCMYDEAQQLEVLRPLLLEMVAAAEQLPETARGLELYRDFADRFTPLAASFKHHSFDEENEWRLLFGPGVEPARTGARVSGSMMVPFFKCPIKRNGRYPIAKVVVGPSPTAHLAGRSLRYITTSRLGWPVDVTMSESSFRTF